MGVFSPKPEFRSATPQERMGLALDEPFTFTEAVGQNFQQGILDSFGLGTTVRAFQTGGDSPTRFGLDPISAGINTIFQLRDNLAPDTSKTLTPDEYKASPYFRDQIPYDAGMTENRAAALASFFDQKAVRQHFSEKQPIAAFAGQFFGQAFDPINYVPIFGPVAHAAVVARAGSIAGRALLGASEAAINTAAFGTATANIRAKFGDDVSWQAIGLEIGMSALIGGVFGGGIGVFARGADARAKAAEQKARFDLDTARNAQESLVTLNEAIDGLATRGEVELSPNGIAPVERIRMEAADIRQASLDAMERIDSPALMVDGRIFKGATHTDALDRAAKELGLTPEETIARIGTNDEKYVAADGFVTYDGRFVSRAEADKINSAWREASGLAPSPKLSIHPMAHTGEPAAAVKIGGEVFTGKIHADAVEKAITQFGPDSPEVRAFEDNPEPAIGWVAAADTETERLSLSKGFTVTGVGREVDPRVGQRIEDARLNAPVDAEGMWRGGDINTSPPKPEPPPEGLDVAAARVGKPEGMKELAEQHGVDLTTGDYAESFDIDQMRAEGRLSKEDEAALKAADDQYDTAEAYGSALKAAMSCVI